MTFFGIIETQEQINARWGVEGRYMYSEQYGQPYNERMADEDSLLQKLLLLLAEEAFLEKINFQHVVNTGYY